MEKFKNWFTYKKVFNFLSCLILASSTILIFTKYNIIFKRFINSLIYLKDSLVNWFNVFFLRQESSLQEGVTSLDLIDLLPFNSTELLEKFENFFVSFVKFETFSNYYFDFTYYSILYLYFNGYNLFYFVYNYYFVLHILAHQRRYERKKDCFCSIF